MHALVPLWNRSSASSRSSFDTALWWTNTSVPAPRMFSATASVIARDWQKKRLFLPRATLAASRASDGGQVGAR